MKYLEILRQQLAALHEQRSAALSEMEAVTETAANESRSALTDTETAAFEEARGKVTSLDDEITAVEERIGELEKIGERSAAAATAPAAFQVTRKTAPVDVLEDRSATPAQLADAITRSVEDAGVDADGMASVRSIVRRHAGDQDGAWARNVLARSTPAYVSAFEKIMRANGGHAFLTTEEQRAIVVGTNTSGGFLVPTVIDPTLIYTNNGTDNVIRQISRKVTLTGDANAINVISTAGVTASWDPELTEVSDDSPEVARPNIPIHKAAAFIMASIEATQDMGALFDGEGTLRGLFADAKDRLEGTAFATGSGTNQPTGIFTALDANTNVELTSTTAATLGLADLHTVYRSLPVRWRRRASWLTNPLYSLSVKTLGTALSASYSTDLTQEPADRILGRPWYEAEDAPSTQTTTSLDNVLVFGDFSNYVIADKPGSFAVEYIPHIFGATNGRPLGARGWYAYWRTGADSVNDLAFRLLQDKTSA